MLRVRPLECQFAADLISIMDKLLISGGVSLKGEIRIAGAKNDGLGGARGHVQVGRKDADPLADDPRELRGRGDDDAAQARVTRLQLGVRIDEQPRVRLDLVGARPGEDAQTRRSAR